MPKTLKSRTALPTAALVSAALALGGCANQNPDETRETIGMTAGAVIGAIIGAKFGKGTGSTVATIIGAAGGAYLGKQIAAGLNERDKLLSDQTTRETLDDAKPGETRTWSNPDTGHSGSTVAGQAFASAKGDNCREFETTVDVNGDFRTATGVACRQTDGSWEVVSGPGA
ncbi:MAG: glycine zipper 2TM domain-containing protein [Alphaproteobacteria bacterium]|nr:glycine zipper 2TM domain-containing protein [Alphaproteobacteria bacterium]MBF0251866.1 glycine zipper 2TM domain-containing protein [Alphaproteobacteria bacterium]